ncbi:MAG: lycopene cyclase [Bacteroidetes bacterium]|jgi:lycopene beta-cyclase|nr:lycopene cyclase [Bacteroidota bacterium]
MSSKAFDYIIIGSGASGLQLALAMLRDTHFDDKMIGIIEKRTKFTNDKTWCYWETGQGLYDNIIHKSWNKGVFKANGETIPLNLAEYRYKMIKSIDFYTYAKSKIKTASNIQWIEDEITKTEENQDTVQLRGKHNTYLAKHIFDSRLPEKYKPKDSINILQHFKGWFIKTEENVFNPDTFCMMDYDISDHEKTCFIYVLPFTKNKALVEFTYFSPEQVNEETYEHYIKSYLKEKLNLTQYQIYEEEKGVIPMSSHPFYKHHRPKITKIGTSGGWVKASTGYSFKNAERNSIKIINNIKEGKSPHHHLYDKRFKHYDKMFLDVLYNHNEYGQTLFYKMYKYNDISQIFKFLDEQTKPLGEVKMMLTMTSFYFIKALLKHIAQGFKIK